jgi:drug/metabolite transporter (DMT)-like permease
MRSAYTGVLAICLAAILWGLDGVVLTPRLFNLTVPFVVFLLHAVPFLLMQPLLYRSYRALASLSILDWTFLSLVALTGGVLGTFTIVKALFLVNFSQVSVVVLLQKLQPVFAIVLAAILLKEPLTPRFVGWSGIALVGAYLLTFGAHLPDLTGGTTTTIAATWAAIAAAAFGTATVLGKRVLAVLDFRQATFGRYGLTSVFVLLYLVVSGDGLPFGEVTRFNWLLILVIGLTTGSGAIFLYYFGLTRVRASVSAVCELCLPLSAILLDYLINGSVLRPWQWVGAATLILAITMVSLQPGERRRSATPTTPIST